MCMKQGILLTTYCRGEQLAEFLPRKGENVLFPMSIPWQIFARTKQAYLIGYSFCKQKPQKMFIFKSDFIPQLSLRKLNIPQVTLSVKYGDSRQM